jgi:hypothetical protein
VSCWCAAIAALASANDPTDRLVTAPRHHDLSGDLLGEPPFETVVESSDRKLPPPSAAHDARPRSPVEKVPAGGAQVACLTSMDLGGPVSPFRARGSAKLAAEFLDAPAAFAQAGHVGGVGDAEVGAHAIGRASHGGDVFS